MTTASATKHQSFQPMPRLDTPFVDSDGVVAPAWYRWLISIWVRTGCNAGKQAGSSQTAGVVATSSAGLLTAYDLTGNVIGQIITPTTPGGPAQVQTLGSSPFVFTAAIGGALLVASGKTELSRDLGVTYYTVGLQGGMVPVLASDRVRVSWTSSAPTVVFVPGS